MPPHPSSFVRRELLLRLGGFDESYRLAADFDLIARALLRERASYAILECALVAFRSGGASTSGLSSKLALGREFARSLARLGQPLAPILVQLRFLLKLPQMTSRRPRDMPGAFFRREGDPPAASG